MVATFCCCTVPFVVCSISHGASGPTTHRILYNPNGIPIRFNGVTHSYNASYLVERDSGNYTITDESYFRISVPSSAFSSYLLSRLQGIDVSVAPVFSGGYTSIFPSAYKTIPFGFSACMLITSRDTNYSSSFTPGPLSDFPFPFIVPAGSGVYLGE